MSMLVAHFAVGVFGTALLGLVFFPWILRSPTLVFAGGIWGMLPDIHWVLPVGGRVLQEVHRSAFVNIFWLHHLMDRIDPSNSRPVAAVVVGLAFLGLVLVELYAVSAR